jgi:hypothetical protein
MTFLEKLNWVSILGFLIALEIQISNGSMSFAHSFPEAWIPVIKEWSANLATAGGLLVGTGAFGRPTAPQIITIPPTVKS